MTIQEIIDKELIGNKFILNQNFTLEESFDSGTRIFIEYAKYDFDGCYKIGIKLVEEDFKDNFSIAHRDWFDMNLNPTLNIYECLFKDSFKGNKLIKPIHSEIYVMCNDDWFDLDLNYLRNKKLEELGI